MKEKLTVISNEIIRKFKPCYDPVTAGIPDGEVLPIADWVDKYIDSVKSKEDILWLLLRNDFLSDRELRLFAVWCARGALSLIENPDQRSINACDVAERFANGEATQEELATARDAARGAARGAARDAARDAAWDAARDAAWDAAWGAARDAAWDKQITKLLEYFK